MIEKSNMEVSRSSEGGVLNGQVEGWLLKKSTAGCAGHGQKFS